MRYRSALVTLLVLFFSLSDFMHVYRGGVGPAAIHARGCNLSCQCKQRCASAISACIAAGSKRKACRKGILRSCKRQGLQVCLPQMTPTTTLPPPSAQCQPYASDCIPAPLESALFPYFVFTGNACSNQATDTGNAATLSLDLRQVRSAEFIYLAGSPFGTLPVSLDLPFSSSQITVNSDGTILLDDADGGGQGSCPQKGSGVTLRHRVTITRACAGDFSTVVLGSFDALIRASLDGSTCEVKGYFIATQ